MAFKIEDGSQRALNPTVVAILDQMGGLTHGRSRPGRLTEPPILNHRREEVGRIMPAFTLEP